jgi:ribosome assembly protein YihI (activator of Der GTPase)
MCKVLQLLGIADDDDDDEEEEEAQEAVDMPEMKLQN